MRQTHGTWGRRIVTWQDNTKLIAILYLNPFKRCSWHMHKHAANQFFVISGELTIKTDIGPSDQLNFTTITAGESFEVSCGVFHEFITGAEPTIIEEIAFVEYDKNDIERKALGGDITELDLHGHCKKCGKSFTKVVSLNSHQETECFPDLDLTVCSECQ